MPGWTGRARPYEGAKVMTGMGWLLFWIFVGYSQMYIAALNYKRGYFWHMLGNFVIAGIDVLLVLKAAEMIR